MISQIVSAVRPSSHYLDDILIYSTNAAQHERDLSEVLQLLRDHNLHANAAKCTFFTPEIKYLGHIINKDGISVDMHCGDEFFY
jgi:hypothetical protein